MSYPYLSQSADGAVLLHVYVQPKASKSKVVGLFDGCLKIAITAPPVDGKANEEVVKFLARLLDIPGRNIAIQAGGQSRRKRVLLRAARVEDILAKIEAILAKGL
ncbi:MAG: hypothetical protein ACD_75C00379G0002 [uncultured bacterium]|nr:MAG: hypothetical protein ACD_75C00379G0002 [uncultured bacterium]